MRSQVRGWEGAHQLWQLHDYLDAPVAFRPIGFDPMVNVATVSDIVVAIEKATHGSGEGVFNIEQFDPEPFLQELALRGLPWHVKEM